ncbi:MAG: STAS domain-containing protein [Opitutales bacterium]|nr:STAS domain-containing protein [Opitutales bacterium]
MAEELPVFLVDPNSDPVAVKIVGRASFQNVLPLKDFLKDAAKLGKRCYVFDFAECTSMDSTVLGVLAGCALELRKREPQGSVVLSRLSERNQALVRSLGLHRIAKLDTRAKEDSDIQGAKSLSNGEMDELESARLCLEAHEKLVEADRENQVRFQDVISYLKNRVAGE